MSADVIPNDCFEKLPDVFKPRISNLEYEESLDLMQVFHNFASKFNISNLSQTSSPSLVIN